MKGDAVPDPEHVARYCGGASVHEDGSVDGSAFRLRDHRGETFLSVNWLELLDPSDRYRQLTALRQTYQAKNFNLRPAARFAVLQVGEVRTHVRDGSRDSRELQVLHQPEPDDSSHCGIFGLRAEDDVIADLIAETVHEIHPARNS